MLINSDDIKTTKQYIEVMQAFIDGKEIECKEKFENNEYEKIYCPTWDFANYQYRIKPSEPEYVYPIYKRLKEIPETVVKFTSIDSGIYIGTEAKSIYRPGDKAKDMSFHTSYLWEDYTVSEDAEKIILNKTNTIELFEVIYYCDGTEEYSIRGSLYYSEDLENKKHYQKTGRSFIIDTDTRQIIKVINK